MINSLILFRKDATITLISGPMINEMNSGGEKKREKRETKETRR
jgi:hypothetical protein